MEFLVAFFVGKPQNILAVAVVFRVGYATLQVVTMNSVRHPRSLLMASTAWALYAVWEWLVQIKTPEANIRVDLLVIWPILAIFSVWALFRTFR